MAGKTGAPARTAVLEGEATYRERIALPPGAVFEASIQDVAIADAPATPLAGTRFEPRGQVPIRFRIEYDPSKLDPRARYSLSARITIDGRLRWITDQHYPAFVDGRPQTGPLLLRAVGDLGTWRLDSDGGTLRKVDPEGMPLGSQPDHELRRSAAPAGVIEPRLVLRGAYFHMADSATFTECLTGRRMAVAMEGDSVALERAYLAAGGSQKGPMMASIEGRITQRPPMEGDGLQPTIVVERFVSLSPGKDCPARAQ